MRMLRPALLSLLSAAVGLGVPAAFSQQAKSSKSAANSASRTTTSGKNSASGSRSGSSRSTAGSAAKSKVGGSPATTQGGSSARKSSRKSSLAASKRSRRQPGQKAPTTDRITEIQSALVKNGSYTGDPNGKWDDSTTAAVRKFQSSHGLSPTGKLDAPTLQRLGLGSTTAGVAAPTPPPGAVSRLSSSILTAPAPDDAPRE